MISSNYHVRYKVSYKDNSFYIEDEKYDENGFLDFIKTSLGEVRSLVIREDVKLLKDFTIDNSPVRMYLKVYNKNGIDPQIGEVYCTAGDSYFIDNEFGLEKVDDNYLEDLYNSNEDDDDSEFKDNAMVYYDEVTGDFKKCFLKKNNKVAALNKMKKNAKLNDIVKKYYPDVVKVVLDMFSTIPQIELAGVEIALTDDGVKILNIFNNPSYCSYVYFNEDFHSFLTYKYSEKKELYKPFTFKFKIFRKKIYLKICRLFAKTCYPKGLVPYISLFKTVT